MANTYRHSGSMSAVAPVVLIGAGIVSAVLLGIVYVFVLNWIPWIYVTFVAPLAFGGILGGVIGKCASGCRVRNNVFVIVLTLVCSMLGMYVAWIFDGMAKFGIGNVPVLWHPEHLREYITEFYREGFWATGKDAEPVRGIQLAIVWGLEAATVIGLAVFTARASTGNLPFCEMCDCWTASDTGFCRLMWMEDSEEPDLDYPVTSGDLAVFQRFATISEVVPGSLRFDVCMCPQCDQSIYLTINRVRVTVDKLGAQTFNAIPLVRHLRISATDLAMLRTKQLPESSSNIEDSAVSYTSRDAN